MAYGKDGYPLEQASKIGHLSLVGHPVVRQLVESFESTAPAPETSLPAKTGSIELQVETPIQRIITIDGGQGPQTNPVRQEKAITFVQVVACLLRMSDLRHMRDHPMMDPREVKGVIESNIWYNPAVVPRAGFTVPGLTVRQTIRHVVEDVLTRTRLYETLKFLVYREWEPEWTIPPDEQPAIFCLRPSCGREIKLPREAVRFECQSCGGQHRLADYLAIGADSPEDWATEDVATALRDALEVLTLFHFIRKYHSSPVLGTTLFVKDGPLLLRAALSRLVVPIRDFVAYLRDRNESLYLIGVEKSGMLVDFVVQRNMLLPEPGDYFLPSIRYLMEEVAGSVMTAQYRNRVAYGAKVAVRLGPSHTVVLNVPTGGFLTDPTPNELIGFESAIRALSELVSYRYTNALIPLVLANSAASIARRPSGDILSAFAQQLAGA